MAQFNKHTSKLKFVILLKNGNNHLKTRTKSGKFANPTFYNFDTLNKFSDDRIIQKMLVFLKKQAAYTQANCILVYKNRDNSLVRKITC